MATLLLQVVATFVMCWLAASATAFYCHLTIDVPFRRRLTNILAYAAVPLGIGVAAIWRAF